MVESGPRFWLMRHGLKLAASIVAGIGLWWVLKAGGLPVWPTPRAWTLVRWDAVLTFAVLWTFVLFVRSARWFYLLAPLERVSLTRVLTVSLIGLGALVVLPLRTGELVRPLLIQRDAKLSGWAAMGTIGAERVIDGLVLSALLFVALLTSTPIDPLPDRIGDLPVPVAAVPRAAYFALAVFSSAFVMMAMFYWRRDLARRLTERVFGWVAPRASVRIADTIERVSDGLSFLPRPRYAGPFLLCTAAYWLANAAGIYALLHGCGFHDATFSQAAAVLGVLALGILTPNAPGLFGTFQLSVYAGLAMYFASARVVEEGSVFVFLLYALQLGLTLLAASIALVVHARLPRHA